MTEYNWNEKHIISSEEKVALSTKDLHKFTMVKIHQRHCEAAHEKRTKTRCA